MTTTSILIHYYPILLGGLWVTLQLFLSTSVIGIALGIILGSLGAKNDRVGALVKTASFLVAGIPLIVLLYWFYYPFQSFLNISISPFATALIVLAIVDIAAIAEIVREVLSDFPKQYVAAAHMSGLTESQILWKIQFPMIFRQILPSLLTTQIYILQATLFASLISVQEIFRVAQNINASIYRPIDIYSTLAIFFMLILGPLNYIAHVLKTRLTRDFAGS